MLFYLLLFIKLVFFTIHTKVSISPWLVLALDMVIVSLLSFLFFKKERWARWASLAVYALISIILFVDINYFFYFNRLPVVRELGHANVLGGVTDAIGAVFKPISLIYVLDLPILFFYVLKDGWSFIGDGIRAVKNGFKSTYHIIKSGEYVTELSILSLAIFLIVVIIGAPSFKGAAKQSIFIYHTLDIAGVSEKEEEISSVEINEIVEEEKSEEPYKNAYTGIAHGKNLIVIQVESLNNFVIGREYNGREITPNLNKLIADKGSIYASDYYETIGAGNTSDAEFVSMTSFYPSMKNPSYEVYLDKDLYAMPRILKERGYNPIALHGYKRDFWIRDRAYPKIGFDRFYAEDDYDLSDIIGMGLSDKSFFKQSLPIVKEYSEKEDPFFAFMVTLTSHVPYNMPESEIKIEILPQDKGTLFGNYINAVHYTDEAIGEFIDGLKEAGIYDNSIIAVYGDHHGFTGMDKDINDRIGEFIGQDFDYDTLLNIPLIMHVPSIDKSIAIDGVRSQLDFLPTILNLMGIPREEFVLFGEDILKEDHYATLFPQSYMQKGSFIDDDYLFKMKRDGIFENGELKDRHTREVVDINKAKEKYELGIKRINLSRTILENDLIASLMHGKSVEDIKVKEIDIKDSVRVHDSYDILQAYRSGFSDFYVKLFRTKDGFYSTKDANNIMDLSRLNGNFITLGDINSKYKNMRFIIETDDIVEFAAEIRKLPGLMDNLTLIAKNKEEYEKLSNKQNGFNILVDGSGFTDAELISMNNLNKTLSFINTDAEPLKNLTLHEYDGKDDGLKYIYDFDEIKISNERAYEQIDDKISSIEILPMMEALSIEELSNNKWTKPLTLKFELKSDDPSKVVFYTNTITKEYHELDRLKEAFINNPDLKVVAYAPLYNYEIMRIISNSRIDLSRIIPYTTDNWQVSYTHRLGYGTFIYEDGLENKTTLEIRKLWGASSIKK
ncbi:MAG: LTA synthase family protein [Ezakiella sp.]|nr:LTA synthase family protein [Ezakiella sp.]